MNKVRSVSKYCDNCETVDIKKFDVLQDQRIAYKQHTRCTKCNAFFSGGGIELVRGWHKQPIFAHFDPVLESQIACTSLDKRSEKLDRSGGEVFDVAEEVFDEENLIC